MRFMRTLTVPRVVAEVVEAETVRWPCGDDPTVVDVCYWLCGDSGWKVGESHRGPGREDQRAMAVARRLVFLRKWFAGGFKGRGGLVR